MLLDDAPIAIDSFNHPESGLLFFCSHAHEDHLQGLHGAWKRGTIYCSPVSARLLSLRWPALAACLHPLALGPTHRLPLVVSEDSATAIVEVEVTLLDAHHVPGAVMFVFSGYFGTLLYTGDFRFHPEHVCIGSLPSLRGGLTRIFLDNTFCHPAFQYPSREAATREIIEAAVHSWPCVLFIAVYQLGKESLMSMLAQHLCTRVLVTPRRHEELAAAGVPTEEFMVQPCEPLALPVKELWRLSLGGCVWAVTRKQLRPALWRASSNGVPALGIIPSGWSALKDEGTEGIYDGVEDVPYSDHCSFLELVQFLSCLPLAPVTFNSPLSQAGGKFGYDGAHGMRQLLQLSGTPSISFEVRAEKESNIRPSGRPLKGCARRAGVAQHLPFTTTSGPGPCLGLRMCSGDEVADAARNTATRRAGCRSRSRQVRVVQAAPNAPAGAARARDSVEGVQLWKSKT